MVSRLALTPSIAVAPRVFDFLLELLCELDKMEPASSKAEYLCLALEAAEIEAEVDDEGTAKGGPGGRRLVVGLSLLLSPSSLSSKSTSVAFPFAFVFAFPLSFSFPLPLPFSFPFPLLDEACMFEAAPRDCCEA